MPSYCEFEEDRRNVRYYGDTPRFTEEDGDDLYDCGEPHCADCYPDGPDDCDCYDCRESRSARGVWPVDIRDYGWKPNPVFWTTGHFTRTRLGGRPGDRTLYLGTEVEVEVEDGDPYRLGRAWTEHSDFTEHLYCKDDSSLDNGVEIISHPGTLAGWQSSYRAGDLDFYRDLAAGGCVVGETTGQHVHLNRSSFNSDSHQVRFGLLILLNEGPMTFLAGRSNEHYATFDRFPVTRSVRNGDYCPRGAVNYLPRQTIEVRMFAATLDPRQILANLELCAAMHDFTADKRGRTTGELLSFDSFAAFTAAESARYPMAAKLVATV